MHTFRSSFRQINDPPTSCTKVDNNPAESAPSSPTSVEDSESSNRSSSYLMKKISPTTTANVGSTTGSNIMSTLTLSPSFLRRKKEKLMAGETTPPRSSFHKGVDQPILTNTVPGSTKMDTSGVNPNKGIMTLGSDDDAVQLPKRDASGITSSPVATAAALAVTPSFSPSSPTTSNNTIRDSFFRIRSPSLKNKVNNNSNTSDKAVVLMSSSTLMEDTNQEEDDPVLALYTSRNTQKVRFSLGEVEPKERTMNVEDGSTKEIGHHNKRNVASSSSYIDSTNNASSTTSANSKFNIKKFMRGALFGSKVKNEKNTEFELEFEREMEEATKSCYNNEMIWSTQEDGIPELLRTTAKSSTIVDAGGNTTGTTRSNSNLSVDGTTTGSSSGVKVSFAEDYETRAAIIKLINKARRAQFLHYRYEYAVKCYVRALEILRSSNYPEDHPTVVKTLNLLQSAHHANCAYNDSANIVKLGIKYEDSGELIRALKMYTIAYRIRNEALGPNHPSLVVILNMLGSVQIKCGELDEAMAIYELALKDTEPPKNHHNGGSSGDDNNSLSSNTITSPDRRILPTNYVTRAVTYREMGTIYEQWGDPDRALRMYHKSLDCMAEYKGLKQSISPMNDLFDEKKDDDHDVIMESSSSHDEILHDLESTHLSTTAVAPQSNTATQSKTQNKMKGNNNKNNKDKDRSSNDHEDRSEEGGMELTFGESRKGRRGGNKGTTEVMTSRYDIFFPPSLDEKKRKIRLSVGGNSSLHANNKKNSNEKMGDFTDVDVALTIHRIAQLHRAQQEYDLALPAFYVSLRGMKYALGKSHPNVAAILGNIGNLQKEMGDMDSAYTTYQQVLAIESYRLGLSHPDVVVTLHNISTIDAARGNHEHALSLYTQVVTLQRKLFGEDDESVAVTSACMGDVYERLGDIKSAVECYEEALRIKITALGRHSLEVARLLHKLGKLAISEEDFHLAHSYISKALLVYRLNKLRDDDEWVIDVNRDAADVDAAIAMGRGGDIFEC
jgi:tetratricopeptide (TPR) repeat protein